MDFIFVAEPNYIVPLKCPPGGTFKCDEEEDDDRDYDYFFRFDPPKLDDSIGFPSIGHSNLFYIMTLVPMLFIILICITLVLFLLIKKGKKNYLYSTSRSFSNPNYYSPNADSIAVPTNGKFIWKRLKYDKTQVKFILLIKHSV